MTPEAGINALVALTLMIAVVAAYVWLARRVPRLWHPLAIVAAVTIVSMVVAVSGELLSHDGGSGAWGMLRRSALGGFGWGVLIAIAVWATRRMFVPRRK